ncbi:MFS transporter [Candidatus Hodarchaeum mangrovi]
MEIDSAIERNIIFWISIGHFMNHVGNYLTPNLLIYLQSDILLTYTEQGLLGTIPLFMMIFLSTVVGYLGDRKPTWRKSMIWLGLIGIAIFAFIMSIAQSFIELAIGTILLGIALSTYHPLAFSLINSMPNKDKNMGINAVAGNFGSALTPLVAMLIAVNFGGWRVAFLAFGLIQFFSGLTLAKFYPSNKMTDDFINNHKSKELTADKQFIKTQLIFLVIVLVIISAARAPVFRTLSYFTNVIFADAFAFEKVHASILTAIALGLGSFASFLAGYINNLRIQRRNCLKKERVAIRINMMLLSTGLASSLLLLLALFRTDPVSVLFIYFNLTFFFFLGAPILPTIISEVTSGIDMGQAFGALFTGATLTGALSPTIFGWFVDNFSFKEGFIFLAIVAFLCFSLILLFKIVFNFYYDFSPKTHRKFLRE